VAQVRPQKRVDCFRQRRGRTMTTERTGLENPGCSAQPLADCCARLSREHYMTESLLKAIALDDEIEVEGLAWQRPRKKGWEARPCLRQNGPFPANFGFRRVRR
jgi:hypothetical protein